MNLIKFLVPIIFLSSCSTVHTQPIEPVKPVTVITPYQQPKLSEVFKFDEQSSWKAASAPGKYYSGSSAFAAMAPDCGDNVYNPDGTPRAGCFPCNAFLATMDFASKPGMNVLWSTFGESLECMDRFLKRYSPKPHLLLVHALNNTCIRNHNCAEGELFIGHTVSSLNKALEANDPDTIAQLRHRIQSIRMVLEALWNKNPNTYLMLSTGLEDNYSPKAFLVVLGTIQKDWPYAVIRSGASFGSVPREAHGTAARCSGSSHIISTNIDGDIASNTQAAKFLSSNKNCFNRQLWYPAHQGRNPVDNSIPAPPRQRTFIWTAADVVKEGNLLRNNQ